MHCIVTVVKGRSMTFTIPITREEGSTLLELCGDLASPVTVQSYSHQLEVDLGHQDDHQNTFNIALIKISRSSPHYLLNIKSITILNHENMYMNMKNRILQIFKLIMITRKPNIRSGCAQLRRANRSTPRGGCSSDMFLR